MSAHMLAARPVQVCHNLGNRPVHTCTMLSMQQNFLHCVPGLSQGALSFLCHLTQNENSSQTGASETTSESDSPTRYLRFTDSMPTTAGHVCMQPAGLKGFVFACKLHNFVFASKLDGPSFAPHNEIRSDDQDEAYLV